MFDVAQLSFQGLLDNDYEAPELFDTCNPERELEAGDIINAIESLRSGDFAFFNLNLSDQTKTALSKIQIQEPGILGLYSNLHNLHDKAMGFLREHALSNKDAPYAFDVSKAIIEIVSSILCACGYNDAEVTIRTHNQDPRYFPLWHIDKSHAEAMGLSESDNKSIFVIALKGAPTLYQHTNSTLRKEFNLLANESSYTYGYDYTRQYTQGEGLDKLLPINRAVQSNFGEGSVHLAGHVRGTIHAIPDAKERLVIVVMPDKTEIIKQFDKHVRKI